MLLDIYEDSSGIVILGNYLHASTLRAIEDSNVDKFSLVLITSDDPNSDSLNKYLKNIECFCKNGATIYIFGSNSSRNKRPLHKLVVKAEETTGWTFNNMITGSTFGEVVCFYLEELDINKKENKETISKWTGKKRNLFGRRWINPVKMLDNVYEKYGVERLIEMIIKLHTTKGQWIFDPTSKFGGVAKIAKKFDRKFVCIEENCEDFVCAIENLENT